jgi:signal transduction histidine kinase/ligand-binding sensor domain-containing protein
MGIFWDDSVERFLILIRAWMVLSTVLSPALTAIAVSSSNAQDSLHHEVLTTWTTDQGLPQNFVRAIAQTSDGFLWVGTMNGLVRFDGVRFRGFSTDGPAELQESISGLAPDAADGLWIATARGLLHYRNHEFKPIPIGNEQHLRIDAMARGRDGEVWIYANSQLFKTHGDMVQARLLPPKASALRDLAEDTGHALWIADGAQVFALKDNAVSASYQLSGARVVYADDLGSVFAGDGHRLYRFDGQGFVRVNEPGLGNFVSVMVDHQRRLWMASGGLHGVSRKSGNTKETLTAADGLASDDVRVIFEDRNHDIWLGSISGLQRLHQGIFTTYTASDGLGVERSQVDTVFQQKNGTIWAGTLSSGIAKMESGRWRLYGRQEGLPPGQVRGFAEDGAMPAIAISDYGIFAAQSAMKGKIFARIPAAPQEYISTPVRTEDGGLWFSVPHRGLFRLKNRELRQFGAKEGIADNTIWSLTLDGNGVLWVGAGNQLLRWSNPRFESILTTPGQVLCVTWPRSGGAVLGMLNGLLLRENRYSRVLTQTEGLPGNGVLDVIEDDRENLWIATTRAIARLSREQWTAFAEGRSNHVEPVIYTAADGLRSNAVLPLNKVTAMRAQDGSLWFATARGLSFANATIASEPAVTAVLDSIVVDDKEKSARNLEVAPGQHRITFIYTTPPTVAADQMRFRYRLRGWDTNWIDAGTKREVSYTALRPGSYSFEVMAINREGASSAASAVVSVRIQPYFWQTTWFLVLAICAVAAILVEITRRRTRVSAERLSLRFQERVAERERIAYQIHDTVIQDMIGAALQLELLGFQIADQPAKAESLLGSLAERMRETIARSRNMVWSLHSTAVVQYSLVEVLRHAEAEFRLGVLPEFSLTSVGEARHVHPLVRDEVYRICREALANAFRHSNAKSVQVTVRFIPDTLEVEICDDGDGMDEGTVQHGRAGHFGLPGMQAHAQRIGAQIAIKSALGQGTRISLRVTTRASLWQRLWSHLPMALDRERTLDGTERDVIVNDDNE